MEFIATALLTVFFGLQAFESVRKWEKRQWDQAKKRLGLKPKDEETSEIETKETGPLPPTPPHEEIVAATPAFWETLDEPLVEVAPPSDRPSLSDRPLRFTPLCPKCGHPAMQSTKQRLAGAKQTTYRCTNLGCYHEWDQQL